MEISRLLLLLATIIGVVSLPLSATHHIMSNMHIKTGFDEKTAREIHTDPAKFEAFKTESLAEMRAQELQTQAIEEEYREKRRQKYGKLELAVPKYMVVLSAITVGLAAVAGKRGTRHRRRVSIIFLVLLSGVVWHLDPRPPYRLLVIVSDLAFAGWVLGLTGLIVGWKTPPTPPPLPPALPGTV